MRIVHVVLGLLCIFVAMAATIIVAPLWMAALVFAWIKDRIEERRNERARRGRESYAAMRARVADITNEPVRGGDEEDHTERA